MTPKQVSKSLVLALLGASLLAGCGRKGPLDVPGVVDKNGDPVSTTDQPPVKDRPFLLDPLIK